MDDQQAQNTPDALATEEPKSIHLTPNTSLKAAIGAFRKHMQYEGFSTHTIQAFGSDLNLFGKYLGVGQPIGRVSTKNLNDFLNWMLKERGIPCSPKTYARRVTTLKVFFGWLHSGGAIGANPAAPVVQRSVKSPLPIILSKDETAQLLVIAEKVRTGDEKQSPDARPLLLLHLLLETGVKKGEAVGISLNHIDRSDPDSPFIFIRYRNPSKRYKERKIPISAEWLSVLDEYLLQYNPIDTLFTCTPRNLEYVLRDLEEMASLSKPVSFECLRWTFAVHKYIDGIETEDLRERMGLSEITWRETLSRIRRLATALEKDSGADSGG